MTTTRMLRRPMPLDAEFMRATRDLTLAETGSLLFLALAWWPRGTLPTRPCELGVLLGLQGQQAKAVAERLAPHLAAGSYLHTLRTAHVAKSDRRARAGRKGLAAMRAKTVPASHRHCQATR